MITVTAKAENTVITVTAKAENKIKSRSRISSTLMFYSCIRITWTLPLKTIKISDSIIYLSISKQSDFLNI